VDAIKKGLIRLYSQESGVSEEDPVFWDKVNKFYAKRNVKLEQSVMDMGHTEYCPECGQEID
jgi:hypothetical protein